MEDLDALDAANVLLASPPFREAGSRACARLLGGDASPLIGVTFTRAPDRWLETYDERLGGIDTDVWLVCAGDQARSTAVEPSVRSADAPSGVTVLSVESPGNLTRLGVAMTECLPEAAGGGAPARMCFGSIGTLLQHADGKTVYQFLQVLANHVAAHDVRAHYHVDPTAVGEREINQLKMLFDAVVHVSEDGEVEVRTR